MDLMQIGIVTRTCGLTSRRKTGSADSRAIAGESLDWLSVSDFSRLNEVYEALYRVAMFADGCRGSSAAGGISCGGADKGAEEVAGLCHGGAGDGTARC